MRKTITFDTEYKVESGKVYLDVVVGEGQIGGITVKLSGNLLALKNRITKLPIGMGSSLRNKRISLLVVVQDKLINSNDTSVTFALSGGKSDYKYTCKGTVDVDKDKIEYKINIDLK